MDTFTFMDPPESATSGINIDAPGAVPRIPDCEPYIPEPHESGISADGLGGADAHGGLGAVGRRLADPAISARTLGSLGEDYAAAWLASRGWRVLDRNWRSRYGELDIVAVSPERRLVFVEVKTRRTVSQGTPQEAVTYAKQTNLRRAGVQWLIEPEHRIAHTGVRFDVIAVLVRGGGPTVRHIEGAF